MSRIKPKNTRDLWKLYSVTQRLELAEKILALLEIPSASDNGPADRALSALIDEGVPSWAAEILVRGVLRELAEVQPDSLPPAPDSPGTPHLSSLAGHGTPAPHPLPR